MGRAHTRLTSKHSGDTQHACALPCRLAQSMLMERTASMGQMLLMSSTTWAPCSTGGPRSTGPSVKGPGECRLDTCLVTLLHGS